MVQRTQFVELFLNLFDRGLGQLAIRFEGDDGHLVMLGVWLMKAPKLLKLREDFLLSGLFLWAELIAMFLR